eukprot:SAG31_NODE_6051_length_2191_cov_2.048279_1_plen_278_part_00
MLAPSLGLSASYDDLLLCKPAYPFSVVPDHPIDRSDFFAIMRDTFSGTEFDLAVQPAAGPFGMTDRYDGGTSCLKGGNFERPIGVYRMAYSYVGESKPREPVIHWSPHAAQSSIYFPVILRACIESIGIAIPTPLGRGSVKEIDRQSAYWSARRVKQSAMICWNLCMEHIIARQRAWETKALAILDCGFNVDAKCAALSSLAVDVVADWWLLDDELTLRFGDGWEHEWCAADGVSKCKPLTYPDGWLERVDFVTNAPPHATLWTVERKLEQRRATSN